MKFVRWLIHIPALILSLVMVIDTLAGISLVPFWRNFFIGCAVYAELFGQFVRGLAAAYRKNGQHGKSFLCWLLVIVYIGAFAGVSAVGVFMTKVSTEEQRVNANADNQTQARDSYNRTKKELDNKIAEQNIEYTKNNGKGRNYDRLGEDIERLKEDLATYQSQLNAANQTVINTERSVFSYMPTGARIPMFIAIMFVIYTGLLLTPWPIDLKMLYGEGKTPEKPFPFVASETVPQFNVTVPEKTVTENVTESRTCPGCKSEFVPSRRDQIYCTENCRIKVFRENRKLKESEGVS